MKELREKIKEIILTEVESVSKYHELDKYSVDDALNLIMIEIEKSKIKTDEQ